MKGQAFVTLPTDGAASKALKNTNAYVLNSKPMVVVSFLKIWLKMIGLQPTLVVDSNS